MMFSVLHSVAIIVGYVTLAYGVGLLLAFVYGWWETRKWRD